MDTKVGVQHSPEVVVCGYNRLSVEAWEARPQERGRPEETYSGEN